MKQLDYSVSDPKMVTNLKILNENKLTVLTGEGAPDASLGDNKNIYFDENDFEKLYFKTNGTWKSVTGS